MGMTIKDPALSGVPFNDAYRYMDWLLTVPLLLLEILLVMKLDAATFSKKAWILGAGSALMIVSGYYGELVVTGDLTPRWHCWFASMMYPMSDLQYQAVYNVLSFSLASMMATTMYLWFRAFAVQDRYKSAVIISGLVTFIAAYHYIRIFNSWVGAYHYSPGFEPELTGVPFNDAYRYMDWLLTVPLLLIEILLVMNLDEATYNAKSKTLGVGSALMIVSGYYGELVVTGDLTPRWHCWFASMAFF